MIYVGQQGKLLSERINSINIILELHTSLEFFLNISKIITNINLIGMVQSFFINVIIYLKDLT